MRSRAHGRPEARHLVDGAFKAAKLTVQFADRAVGFAERRWSGEYDPSDQLTAVAEPAGIGPEIPERPDYAEFASSLNFVSPSSPEVSIVIPVHDAIGYTLACLRSLTELRTQHRFEVLVMDDCSQDPGAELLAAIPGVRYFRSEHNYGFLTTCNRALDEVAGEFVVLLNSDTQVDSRWLDAMRKTFDDYDNAGIVGSKLLWPDGQLQEAGGIIWADGGGWNYGRSGQSDHPDFNFVRSVDYVSGASLMIRRQLFESLGRFDQRFEPAYYEDTDLCFSARQAGWDVLYQPAAVVIHHEGVSSGTDLSAGVKHSQVVNQKKFVDKWSQMLTLQPANGTEPHLAADRTVRGHVLIVDGVTPTPDRDSGSIDMVNLIRILLDLEYRVHFVPSYDMDRAPGYTDRLEQMGVVCINAPHYESVIDYLKDCRDIFETVILSRVDPGVAAIEHVEEHCPSAQTVFYTVDLHHVRDRREADLTQHPEAIWRADLREELELGLIDRVDTTIVLSDAERGLLERKGKSNVVVVPLIREISAPSNRGFEQRSGVMFVGGFGHPPNVDAAVWMLDEVWPRLRSRATELQIAVPNLSIVGSDTPDHIRARHGDGVTVFGYVENLQPLFEQVRLSIAPVRFGAGLKGKVATSLDHGVPVVGTSLAFEGMPPEGLDSIAFAADHVDELVQLLLDLHQDADRWSRASHEGRRYAMNHFSLEAVSRLVAPILSTEQEIR